MESFCGFNNADVGSTMRKKRSSRRPHPDSQALLQRLNLFPSSTQPFCDGRHDENKNSSNTIVVSDGLGTRNKLKKLKLKVGGVTHTIHTKYGSDFRGDSLATNFSQYFDGPKHHDKQLLQDNIDGNHVGKGNGLKVKRKDFSQIHCNYRKEFTSRGMTSGGSPSIYEPVRKSKRVPKRRVLDLAIEGNDDEDEELRYLGRLNASQISEDYEDEKCSQIADAMYGDNVEYYGSPRSGTDGRQQLRSENSYEDNEYKEEEKRATSDVELECPGKKLKRGSLDLLFQGRNVSIPITRNRALQSGEDVLSGSGVCHTDLSNCAPSRTKKDKLSEVEQQCRRAEAAQRRKMQSEKAAREAEAEAIRKILGQDSGRKKREEKMKQRQCELAQGKATNTITLASNTVRWVIGPTGTIVTFSEDIGLPTLFAPVPHSYPPPREKCAGPNCTNSYKYRDSKSKLPLCSLHCYRAIHQKMHPLIAC
ncbi:hypothetical protein I3843_02G062500 [Carya illinoinensis]|uniref:INO80 complex subunit B-like conserved region domain-containing protein n=1 Tax=Carya illinoinensis TaxID=32201 RepID=A0A922FVI6_CARIL|nr:hypothetical protein I3842_02G074500 [Carya illinoinensis]KAG6726301.1 hypothetical protein I3842_02G074500 [Carya illinoinensis]KAG7991184.1 hypothetical protein I3843_02G062500 [Carya illinoinensis]KAG7991185.1 hypothetical protein I3843_02G062500 [Carya illinoinensis]